MLKQLKDKKVIFFDVGNTLDRPASGHWMFTNRFLAEAGDREGLYLAFGREIYPPQFFEQCRDALIAAAATVTDAELRRFITLAEGIKGFNVSDELVRIKCPVLALGVYEDAVLDSDATMEIAEKLDDRPDFRLYLYTGYGHAAFDTAPDYRKRMLRFLRS